MRRLGPILVPLLSFLAASAAAATTATAPKHDGPAKPPSLQCLGGKESGLPLPSAYLGNRGSVPGYQALVTTFLTGATYEQLGWCTDKGVRDTGPYIDGVYYGTHPAVRIWYSPAAAQWVVNGRQGDVPDGAMIVKEQFGPPPAGQYEGWSDAQLHQYFFANFDWTFMIRDRAGSADGW